MYQKIMIALDGSKIARAALGHAIRLAAAHNATLHAVVVAEYPGEYYTSLVYDPGAMRRAIDTHAQDILKEAIEGAERTGVIVEPHMLHGSELDDTVAECLEAAARDLAVDLVVMGTHGRRGVRRVLLGSVSAAFLKLTDRPVLLYPDRAMQTDGEHLVRA